jgi:hypothetical protein
MKLTVTLAVLALVIHGRSEAAPPRADPTHAVLAAATYPIVLRNGALTGPAATFLSAATANAQFVLAGENHHDFFTPLFDRAVFRLLHEQHGFDHAVVEQDPLAIERVLTPGLRGNAGAIGRELQGFETVLGFASDQDLAFLAGVSPTPGTPDPLLGIEQIQSPILALSILAPLAPDARSRADTVRLLDAARAHRSRWGFIDVMALDPTTYPRLQALQREFHAAPGSRADTVLTALVKSAEIYSYYRRGRAGEPVGLYNNTVREAWLKQGFIRDTKAAEPDGRLKAFFKFGANHMIRGLNPVGSFSLGNFLNEFAIWNGETAFGIEIVTLGAYTAPDDITALRPLLPAGQTTPVLIDLRPLRPYAQTLLAQVKPEDQAVLRAHLFGYDAIAFFPNSKKATWALTGFPTP